MKTKLFTYKVSYVQTGRTLKIRQALTAMPVGQVCAAAEEKDLIEVAKKITTQSGITLTFR